MEDETIETPGIDEGAEELNEEVQKEEAPTPIDPFDGEAVEEPIEEGEEDEEETLVRNIARKEMVGVNAQVQSLKRQLEVQTYLTDNPEYKEYADQIRQVAMDKRTSGLKMDAVVAATLGTKTIAQIATRQAQKSQERADTSRTAGASKRVSQSEPEWIKSLGAGTQEDWNRLVNEAKQGKFVK